MARKKGGKSKKVAAVKRQVPEHLANKALSAGLEAGQVAPLEAAAVPKSFVFRSGPVTRSVQQLVQDLRRVMAPNTAARLRERKNNKLKDYMAVSGPLGVSHFMMLSQTEKAVNLRIARFPRGPTLTFRVNRYTLQRDIVKLAKRPRSPGNEYNSSPLLVLNNFSGQERTLQLMTSMFQNMFPSINVATLQLASVRRVVLLHLDTDTQCITFRHYLIQVKHIGVSKAVKRVLRTEIPDLTAYQDISEYILREAYAAESDVEDDSATIELSARYPGRGNRPTPQSRTTEATATSSSSTNAGGKNGLQRAVRLVELGPRMDLSLLKIQDGFCAGEILHHAYIKKSKPELAAIAEAHASKAREKAQRRAEQEAAVARKAAAMQLQNDAGEDNEEHEEDGGDLNVDDASQEEVMEGAQEDDYSSDDDRGDFWDDDAAME